MARPGDELSVGGLDAFDLPPVGGSGEHDQLGFVVPDVATAVRQLKALGVVFETFEIGGDRWSGEIAENEYGRVAWFRDSEGNLLNVAQRLDGKSISRKR
jgi:predicted enzyme related to lactoylglutathione lyase